MKKILIISTIAAAIAGPVFAGHANPWATDDDTILSQNHEENLAQSEDTPGEDEMLGVMVQQARGKLDTDLGPSGSDGAGRQADGSGSGAMGGRSY